jgi:REP element-mobilizing transposase RayT
MHNRKPNRLKYYYYSNGGGYFVTICTKDRINHFGEIQNGEMILNEYGKIAKEQWLLLQKQYEYVLLDEYCVMPNHFHGIIFIFNDVVGNGRDRSLQKIKSLSSLVGAFKTTSSKLIHQVGNISFKWQKSFYDRIIRSQKELNNIWNYIHYNPLEWEWDAENKLNEKPDKDYYIKLFK